MKLPKEGWKAITVSEDVYEKLQKFIAEYNAELGYKRFRSASHLAEEAIGIFLKKEKRKQKARRRK